MTLSRTLAGSIIRLFANDTSLFTIVDNPLTAAEGLNTDFDKISQCVATWFVTFNPPKPKALLVYRNLNRPHHPPLFYAKSPHI